jgi:hypothetical protein
LNPEKPTQMEDDEIKQQTRVSIFIDGIYIVPRSTNLRIEIEVSITNLSFNKYIDMFS